jgi:hypothetical protein
MHSLLHLFWGLQTLTGQGTSGQSPVMPRRLLQCELPLYNITGCCCSIQFVSHLLICILAWVQHPHTCLRASSCMPSPAGVRGPSRVSEQHLYTDHLLTMMDLGLHQPAHPPAQPWAVRAVVEQSRAKPSSSSWRPCYQSACHPLQPCEAPAGCWACHTQQLVNSPRSMPCCLSWVLPKQPRLKGHHWSETSGPHVGPGKDTFPKARDLTADLNKHASSPWDVLSP